MRRLAGWRAISGFIATASVLAATLLWVAGATGQVQHGIGFQKGCASPTKIGDPVQCEYTVTNNNFTNQSLDTLTFDYLADVTHASGGDTPEVNILPSLEVYVAFGTPTCAASSGTGTFADPWLGVTSCTLPGGNFPAGSSLATKPHAGYVVKPADFAL